MTKITPALVFVLDITKIQTTINKKFDSMLSNHGLSFNDFIILHHLTHAHGQKLRRIDLAEQIGVTASGVTRMLLPMEKIGLVSREANERDARVSYVVLAAGGKRLYEEALNTAGYAADAIFPASKVKKIEKASEMLYEIIA